MKSFVGLVLSVGLLTLLGCGDAASPRDSAVTEAGIDAGTDADSAAGGSLTVVSSAPRLRVVAGNTVTLDVTLERQEVAGDVTVAVANLPPGVSAQPVTFTEGDSTLPLEFVTVASASQGGPFLVTLDGTSMDSSASASTFIDLYIAGMPATIDASFGTGGLLDTGIVTGSQLAIAIDRRSRLVVASDTLNEIGLTRWLDTGEIDRSFNADAIPARFSALHVFDDGSMVVGIRRFNPNLAFLRRLTVDGGVDSNYGTGGDITLPLPVGDIAAWRTGIVVAASETYAFASAGVPQMGFVTDGSPVQGRLIGVDTSDRVLLATGASGYAFARLMPTGAADTGFGEMGLTSLSPANPGLGGSVMIGMVPSADGRLYALGAGNPGISGELLRPELLRLDAAGALDTGFADAGRLVLDPGGEAWGPGLDASERPVVLAHLGQASQAHA